MLALHAGPIEFATLPFANVAALLEQMPLPVPAILGHSDPDGIVALQDLGDVTLQAHLGAASASRACGALSRGGRAHRLLQRRGPSWRPIGYVPYGSRSTSRS